MNTAEIHYKVPWRASGSYPGHHSSQQQGGGLQFRSHSPLIDAPDPRRFDVRASLRDPFEQIQVRVYQQTSSIPVYFIADLSASMGFEGANSKIGALAEFVACLSFSAYRTGDTFGFIGCAEKFSEPLLLPPTLNRAAGAEFAERLRGRRPLGRDSQGLLGAAELLGSRRALVFLVSDFHFSPALLEQVLASLAYHDVVPVILWDRREYEDLPGFGIARITDPETARSRMLLMRPQLRRRIQQEFSDRREHLFDLFGQYGRIPLLLEDGFDPDEVTRYFFG
ncbi:MAG: hypothetical protein QF609_05545 [Gammaproteobacteria bacterium]|jgi:hypothetical protein|nr:hypothetical protein [Gammaproteobacteria bacterium]